MFYIILGHLPQLREYSQISDDDPLYDSVADDEDYAVIAQSENVIWIALFIFFKFFCVQIWHITDMLIVTIQFSSLIKCYVRQLHYSILYHNIWKEMKNELFTKIINLNTACFCMLYYILGSIKQKFYLARGKLSSSTL